MKSLILGTRGSDLALAQTRLVAARLQTAHPGLAIEEKLICTTGDSLLDASLSQPGALDKGLFTKELEEALLRGEIDAAVHSLKDLPTEQPAGLTLGAILEREESGDVLVSKSTGGFDALPLGAAVATSSLRRKYFLLWRRSDLKIHDIRGNVPTRLQKLIDSDALSALVLANAGLRRLQAAGCALPLDALHISPLDFMLPAPGQGAISVECCSADNFSRELIVSLHHPHTAACVNAERRVLAGLGGGCHMPLGASAIVAGNELSLRAAWFPGTDCAPRTAEHSGPAKDWADTARAVTATLSEL